MTERLADHAAREKAITCRDQNLVVNAGAGTGKTTLLVRRILYLLLVREIPITRIAAVTFTNKAAAEMLSRLGSRLTDVLAHIDGGQPEESDTQWLLETLEVEGVDRKHGRTLTIGALAELDRAVFSTLHGLCNRILRLFPAEAGVDPLFVVDDDDRLRRELFDQEWDAYLRRELSSDGEHLDTWRAVLRSVAFETCRDLARTFVNFELPLNRESVIERAQEIFRVEYVRIAAGLRRWTPGCSDAADNILVIVNECLAWAEWCEKEMPTEMPDWLNDGRSLRFKKKNWDPEAQQAVKEILNELREFIRGAFQAGAEVAEAVVEVLEPFTERFRKIFLGQGLLSHDAGLVLARDLLRNHPGVRRRVQGMFDQVMVDEFQDTDPIQSEIVLYLSESSDSKAGSPEEVRLENGKLFVVGDPKQSIYRFRGADIESWADVRERVIDQGGEELTLSTNFRSTGRILEGVNWLFERMIQSDGSVQPEYREIVPPPSADDGDVSVAFRLVEADDVDQSDELHERDARSVVNLIRERKAAGRDYRDIALLFRKMTPVETYVRALQAAEIPFLIEGGKHFYTNPEVRTLLNVLRVLHSPHDEAAFVGILRSPLCGATDPQIFEWRKPGPLSLDRTDLAEPATSMVTALQQLRDFSRRLPMDQLLDRVFEILRLPQIAALAFNGEQQVANLYKLRDLVGEMAERGDVRLDSVVARLEASVQGGEQEQESPLADESVDAVTIMTVHKSKGLEFPVVILCDMHSSPKGRNSSIRSSLRHGTVAFSASGYKSPGWEPLKNFDKRREESEERRLLYVACTRAKEELYICGALGGSDRTYSLSALAKFEEACALEYTAARDNVVEILPVPVPPEEKPNYSGDKREDGSAAAWQGAVEAWTARRELVEQAGEIRMRPSDFAEHAGTFDPEVEQVIPGYSAADLGSLCHFVLEHWDYSISLDEDSLAKQIAESVEVLGIFGEEIRSEAAMLLSGFLNSEKGRALAEVEILGREVPFIAPADGAVMTGVIDLLYRRADGTLVVADYKTDRDPSELEEKYAGQVEAYRSAVHAAFGESPDVELIALRR